MYTVQYSMNVRLVQCLVNAQRNVYHACLEGGGDHVRHAFTVVCFTAHNKIQSINSYFFYRVCRYKTSLECRLVRQRWVTHLADPHLAYLRISLLSLR
jgi:hypothetical protein